MIHVTLLTCFVGFSSCSSFGTLLIIIISALAIGEILQFLSRGFSAIEAVISSPVAVGLSAFPATIFLAYKYLKIDTEDIVKHVLCPKCYSLFKYDEMLKLSDDGSFVMK